MAVNRNYAVDGNPDGVAYPNTTNQLIAGYGGVNGYPSGSTFKTVHDARRAGVR